MAAGRFSGDQSACPSKFYQFRPFIEIPDRNTSVDFLNSQKPHLKIPPYLRHNNMRMRLAILTF